VAHPPPAPLHNSSTHALLFAPQKNIFVGHSLQMNAKNSLLHHRVKADALSMFSTAILAEALA